MTEHETTKVEWSNLLKNDAPFCIGIICATVVFLVVFVWPTPFFYETISRKHYDISYETIYRINRFSGEAIVVASPYRTPETTTPKK